MSIFFVTIENDFIEGQGFILEADDFVSATMKATDFLQELDRRMAEKLNESDRQPTKIMTINNTQSFWANEDGLQKYLDDVVAVQQEDED